MKQLMFPKLKPHILDYLLSVISDGSALYPFGSI